jgi:hypothetical protein
MKDGGGGIPPRGAACCARSCELSFARGGNCRGSDAGNVVFRSSFGVATAALLPPDDPGSVLTVLPRFPAGEYGSGGCLSGAVTSFCTIHAASGATALCRTRVLLSELGGRETSSCFRYVGSSSCTKTFFRSPPPPPPPPPRAAFIASCVATSSSTKTLLFFFLLSSDGAGTASVGSSSDSCTKGLAWCRVAKLSGVGDGDFLLMDRAQAPIPSYQGA